jgi:hypothetical protein
MGTKYGRIGLILVVAIVAGGILVAFLGYASSPAQLSSATYEGAATIPLTGGGYNPYGSVVSITTAATTATMTATSLATSTYVSVSSSTISFNGGQQETGATAGQQPLRPTANGQFIEFFSNITLRVSSPASALDKASEVGYSLGGYVAYSALMNTTAFVVLRVPPKTPRSP